MIKNILQYLRLSINLIWDPCINNRPFTSFLYMFMWALSWYIISNANMNSKQGGSKSSICMTARFSRDWHLKKQCKYEIWWSRLTLVSMSLEHVWLDEIKMTFYRQYLTKLRFEGYLFYCVWVLYTGGLIKNIIIYIFFTVAMLCITCSYNNCYWWY